MSRRLVNRGALERTTDPFAVVGVIVDRLATSFGWGSACGKADGLAVSRLRAIAVPRYGDTSEGRRRAPHC